MLISFKVSNFKSILEPICLNMLADPDDQSLKQSLYTIEERPEIVNPFSVVMGANGSGKSSIVDALSYVKSVAIKEGIKDFPRNRASKDNEKSNFEVIFYSQFCIIGTPIKRYVLEVSPENTFYESLSFFGDNKWNVAYEQSFSSHKINLDISSKDELRIFKKELNAKENMKNCEKELRLFFHNLIIFNSIDQIIDPGILEYIGDSRCQPMFREEARKGEVFLSGYLYNQDVFKKEFITFVQNLGINIIDAEFEEIHVPGFGIKPIHRKKKELDESLPLIESENIENLSIFPFVYKLSTLKYSNYTIPINEESSGTKRLIMIVYYILNFLLKDDSEVLLVIDEMDAGLHDTLAKEIVNQYFDICKRRGRKTSQLVITSHNTVLMRDIPLRKDQIWFTEMKKDRTTDLFSLADIKGVKSSEDFAENYLRGKYGALPQIKKWMNSEADNE